MTQIACPECSTLFEPRSNGGRPQKFCCRKCFCKDYERHPADDRYTSRDAICEVCKKQFVKNKRHQVYCSTACYKKAWPVLNREAHNVAQKKKYRKNIALFRKRSIEYARKSREKTVAIYPWAYLLKSRKNEAKLKGLPFELDHEWAAPLWPLGCAITGLPFQTNAKNGPWPFSPSIDQIKPGLGYTKDNARFILWGANALKGAGTDEDMYKIARAIVARLP